MQLFNVLIIAYNQIDKEKKWLKSVPLEKHVILTLNMAPMGFEPSAIASMVPEMQPTD